MVTQLQRRWTFLAVRHGSDLLPRLLEEGWEPFGGGDTKVLLRKERWEAPRTVAEEVQAAVERAAQEEEHA